MTKTEHILFWKTSAEHDLVSMERIFESGTYDWALFVGHLAIEKLLKSIWIKNNTDNIPPRTHNLIRLYRDANLTILNEADIIFLNEVTGYNIETRYPEQKLSFYQLCTKYFTKQRITKLKELFQCLLKEI